MPGLSSLTMPNVGEGVTEGTVTRWLKHEGDSVRRNEPVVEVETDKAVVEVPSPVEGRLIRLLVAEDQTVPIGTPLAEFEVMGVADGPAVAPDGGTQAAPEERATPSPATRQPPPSRPAPVGEQTPQPARPSVGRQAARTAATERQPDGPAHRSRRYSPVVLALAEEHGLDLDGIEGTGIGGRVTRKDVLRQLEQSATAAERSPAPAVEAPAAPTEAVTAPALADGDSELVPLSATRRTIARHMAESHRTVPVAWMVVEADVTNLVRLRDHAKEAFRRDEGVNLTYLPFFVQAVVTALKQHREINCTYTDDGVVVHRHYHIGIAAAVEAGLLVPVIRDADRKSIPGLARELDELGRKARERRLTLDEMRGATFTVDNTGAFGSVISQPIVPMGQAAIITTEAIRRELRVGDDGSFGVRSVVNLCISFDHRALDGRSASSCGP